MQEEEEEDKDELSKGTWLDGVDEEDGDLGEMEWRV